MMFSDTTLTVWGMENRSGLAWEQAEKSEETGLAGVGLGHGDGDTTCAHRAVVCEQA